MRIQRLVSIAAVITALSVSSSALAQALPNLTVLRVRYNTAKTSAKPQGDLKTQIDQIDKDLAEAARMGRAGEQRRLLARGFALLAGRPWTDTDDFQASLVSERPLSWPIRRSARWSGSSRSLLPQSLCRSR